MADYTKTTDFGAKDALASGNANKIIKGSEIDDEFDNIATAIATKYDSTDRNAASGIAGLDASSLIEPAYLPAATETAVGALEIATAAEANARTAADKILVPSLIDGFVDAWAGDAAGIVADLQTYADPNADQLLGWDDSAGAATGFTAGTGLAFTATPSIELSHLGIEDLTDPNDDRILFWDDSGSATGWLDIGDGLTISTTTLSVNSTIAGNGLSWSSGVLALDPSELTTMSIEDANVAQDGIVMSDNGVAKVLPLDEAGIDVINATDADQTFALTDANTLQVLDSTTNRTWTIPTNASVAFKIGTVILVQSINTATITITASTGVTLMSRFNSGGTTATSDTVKAGGRAALIKVAADEWSISGDIQT